eukprot:TRINITY_DN2597_c0_g5_i1.p1 TRINITY_DN2597_c0_g5~~TRINITY_DN2597_c0_g5_i1.p1  ORF type:complete len:342 (+),score=61.79 TRINITY_DN2597_c0_g5_i1:117-1142(+)
MAQSNFERLTGAFQSLCCTVRPIVQRVGGQAGQAAASSSSSTDARLLVQQAVPERARQLTRSFGRDGSTSLRISYDASCPDADRFDAAFKANDYSELVVLLGSDQAVNAFYEPRHPWAEDPRTVGTLAAMHLTLLASEVAKEEPQLLEAIGSAGAIPHLVRQLDSKEADRVQSVVVALTYLTDGSNAPSANATAAFEGGALPKLIVLMDGPVAGLRGAVASCLRNICLESLEYRAQLADLGGMARFVKQLELLQAENGLQNDLCLEALWNLEDMTLDSDGNPLERYTRLAIEAGAIQRIESLRGVKSDEVQETVEKLLSMLGDAENCLKSRSSCKRGSESF